MSDIRVSIICTVYNHEKFLHKCLDGFVMQRTNFKFEALVNDDFSTDDSKRIIEEYKKMYPEIIRPVYQTENQFSKGISISNDILFPQTKGDYITVCEGDDYWSDPYKLQRQFDYMENNRDCSLCTHNTMVHDLSGKKRDKTINDWKTIHVMNEEDVFFGWNVHMSSYMFRKEYYNHQKELPMVWCGDYARLLYAFSKGKVVCLPEIMSVYNINNSDGITWKVQDPKLKAKRAQERIDFLMKYDDFTEKKYEKIVKQRIDIASFDIALADFELYMSENKTNSQYRKIAKKIRSSNIYYRWSVLASPKARVKLWLIFHSYLFFKYFY